ncbi:delta-class carbonic anhydrase [Psychromonas sp. GE-S-Ul-11]|uniref:delta-class carbonic anhydrase n=1 Tax=unclassified Psychromonas TaxID=2614957 RepID=UPI00390CC4F1
MKILMKKHLLLLCTTTALPLSVFASQTVTQSEPVSDQIIEQQRAELQQNTLDKGFGPQSPRDIDNIAGNNTQLFSYAPNTTDMNLCNIHFHKNAEHKGGEFTRYAGNGDGKGNNSGYLYAGQLTKEELTPISVPLSKELHHQLFPGDTIEVHYVYSTANVKPGPTLGSCLSDSTKNPALRVESQVFVLVNDKEALDFVELTKDSVKGDRPQAINIPDNSGQPIQYLGSTTGPAYNQQGSPFQVTWSVRPQVLKVSINTVATWFKDNQYNENHAHGVRNLVTNPLLLSAY